MLSHRAPLWTGKVCWLLSRPKIKHETRFNHNILLHMQVKCKLYKNVIVSGVQKESLNQSRIQWNGIRRKSKELAYLRQKVGLRARLFTNSEFKCMRSNRFTQWVDPVPSFPIASTYVFRRKMGLQIRTPRLQRSAIKEIFWVELRERLQRYSFRLGLLFKSSSWVRC